MIIIMAALNIMKTVMITVMTVLQMVVLLWFFLILSRANLLYFQIDYLPPDFACSEIKLHKFSIHLLDTTPLIPTHHEELSKAHNALPLWCMLSGRHLLKRIEEPMKQFESNQNVLAGRDAKRIIKARQPVFSAMQPHPMIFRNNAKEV